MAASAHRHTLAPFCPGPIERFRVVRQQTLDLVRTLEPDDFSVQSSPYTSPVKWHLGHTTWFFEHFVLSANARYCRFDDRFAQLFNSYYHGAGSHLPRTLRGLLSRPTLRSVLAYRAHVDASLEQLLETATSSEIEQLVTLGLHHEHQHQELILTDLKHAFSLNPVAPALTSLPPPEGRAAPALHWLSGQGAITRIGADGTSFAFDNELPRHAVMLAPFRIASRPVTNGEFREFVRAGGYRDPRLWLADGWTWVQENSIERPLYWQPALDATFTLASLRELDPAEPVSHVSYFEADALARWAGARLPTEAEWETMAARQPVTGNLLGSGRLHPAPAAPSEEQAHQFFGDVWEWTCSPYAAYPGYRVPDGVIGEYNAKFMCSQFVCRGGSCVTDRDEARPTCRNFFYPGDRWQFLGIRLAQDARG